jgi:predicted SnoaL-like aldol condensation-catalyzing enzyme
LWTRLVSDIVATVDSASELNKRKVRLFVEAVWNEGRLELIDELVAADYIGRFPPIDGAVHGPEGVRRLVSRGRSAYPDLYVKIEDQIAEDDRVATRWRATALSGESQCYVGISIVRLLAGKQVDSHTEYADVTRTAV